MDPVTHVMAGALIAHGFSNISVEPAAMFAAVSAAVIPDLDFYARKYQGAKFLKIHHGATHAIPSVIISAPLVAISTFLIFNQSVFGLPHISFFPLLLIAASSHLTHIFLDWIMHNNGLPLLWPIKNQRYAFPLILGVNPRTVSHDCGNHEYLTCLGCQSRASMRNPVAWIISCFGVIGFVTPKWRIQIFVISIAAVTAYLLFTLLLRNRALSAVLRVHPNFETARFFPARARPDRWLFIKQTESGSVSAILAESNSGCILRIWRFTPPLLSPFVLKATDRIYTDLIETLFFPYPEVRFQDDTTFVNFRDLSFLYAEPMELGSVKVQIDSNGSVESEIYQEVW